MTTTEPMAKLESQAGLVQLGAALEQAFSSAAQAPVLAPNQTMVATRVVVDEDQTTHTGHPLARSAFHRMTGFIISTIETPRGPRNWCGRWRYSPPRIQHGVIVGKPSIAPTEKIRVTCRDCKHQEGVFTDAIIAATRSKTGKVACTKCGSFNVQRDYMRLTCDGKGRIERGEDDMFAGSGADVQAELDCLSSIHKAGYDESTKLILPRLWCGYLESPFQYIPEDRIAEQIVTRGLTPTLNAQGQPERPVLHMVPFDLVLAQTLQSTSQLPPLQQLALETLGDAGWVSKEELSWQLETPWKRIWVKFPEARTVTPKFDRDNFSL